MTWEMCLVYDLLSKATVQKYMSMKGTLLEMSKLPNGSISKC